MEERINVLYVDDETSLLDIARLILEKTGNFCVSTSLSAQDALVSSQIPSYDVIVSDYQMPEMDGIAFLKEVRNQYGDIPFILFTGRGREEIVIEAINNDADFYLQKGGDPLAQFAELAHMIRRAVSRKSAELSRAKAENALRESEAKYRHILENMQDAYIRVDENGIVSMVNPSAPRMYGYRSVDEMIGLPATAFYINTGREREDTLRKLHAAGGITDFYGNAPRKDGTTFGVSLNMQIVRDEEGRFLGTESIVRDITERKHVEDALRESEERLQLLIRHAPAAFAMFDRDMRYLAASRRWLSDYNLGDQDIIGRSHYEIFPEISEKIKAVHRKGLFGEVVSADEEKFERQDGSFQWVSWEMRPWYATGRSIGGIIIFSEDITRRKKTEEELRKSEEKYRQLFEISGDALFVTENVTGKIIEVNEAAVKMYGYSRDELLTLCNSDLSAEPGKTLGVMAIDSQDRVKVPVRYHRKKDGTIFPVEITVSFFTWDGRGVNIGSIRDITDRMLSDSALRHSNEKLNLLSSVTRHDIRNQITILRGYATLAQRAGPAPVIGGYLKNIDTAAATISRQIEFTRNYQDIGIHAPGWYRLCDILTRVNPKDIAVSCSCGDLKIFADPMLEKVFSNLFDNAIRHGDHVTKIDIGCQVQEENCVIIVEDDGTGIPADEKEKIFEKGYGKNTGLGLFLAREILAITGITIRETGTPGKGAKFEIAVPKGQFRSAKQN